MVARATRNEFRPDEGVMVIYGDEGAAKDGIAVPLAALPVLAAQARRFLSGQQAKSAGRPSHGPFHLAQHCSAQTYDVGLLTTTQGDKVSLVLDRGLDTEIGFAIEPEHADELGQQLSQSAQASSKTHPTKN